MRYQFQNTIITYINYSKTANKGDNMFTVSFTELFIVLTILIVLLILKNFLSKKDKTTLNEYPSELTDCANRYREPVYVENKNNRE